MIHLHLNGQPVAVSDVPAELTLLRYLRDARRLTGTKEGCAEGDCGACSVALLEVDAATGQPAWRAVNACLVLVASLHGRTVLTVEGLADAAGDLHPAQQALVERMGSQCGYCTPGFVMALFEGCYRADLDDPARREDQICGNLCRCTGYRPIREALADVAGLRPEDRFRAQLASPPPPLPPLRYTDADGHTFLRPASLGALWQAMEDDPGYRLVAGTTDLGLDITKKYARYGCLLSLEGLPELQRYEVAPGGRVRIGAGVRLADLEGLCSEVVPSLARMLRYFASRQIKSRATLGGNLCTASPIGDTAPVLLSLGAEVILLSRAGERRVPLEGFFLAYRKIDLRPGEILAAVEVPPLDPARERAGAYKVSKRRELDISAVCAGMWVRLDEAGRVEQARLAYGGMAAIPARARAAEAALVGQVWGLEAADRAAYALAEDFRPIDDHRGSAWYRATVAGNLLRGFAMEAAEGTAACLPLPPRSTGTILLTSEGA